MFGISVNVSWARRGRGTRLALRVAALALGVLSITGPPSPAAADVVAPSVTVTNPASGATVTGPIGFGADATAEAGVVAVKWYVDGVEVAADTAGAPWTASWDSARISNGVHKVFAKARDAAGNWGSSPGVSFTVDNPSQLIDTTAPTVAVTAPKWGQTLQGNAVTLAANAFDNVAVTRVKWYVDGTEVASDGDGAPWTRTWDSRRVPDGPHRINAKARDAAGNWAASVSVAVNVSNAPCGTTSAPASWDHVVWIVFENKTYSDIIGSANAPYLNHVAAECGLATDFHAIAHPSLPNYIAMTSGSTQGITDDSGPLSHLLAAPSIFSQLGMGGWRALQESMPANCYLSNSGQYAVRHNPAAYYTGTAAACALQDVPLGATPDLSARFTFITPNLCHDMHSSTCAGTTADEVAAGDAWLAHFLPTVFTTRQYRSGSTAVFITWDEDDYSSDQRVPTLVIAPSIAPGTTVATPFDHYSLLRTTEEMLGLPTDLGNAATATSMRAGFGL